MKFYNYLLISIFVLFFFVSCAYADATSWDIVANTTSNDSAYYEFTSVPNGVYHIAAVLNTGTDESPNWNYAKIENISVLNKTALTDVDIFTKSRNIDIPASEMNALLDRTSVSGRIYQSKKDNSNPPFPNVNVLLLKPKQGGQGYDLVANTTSNDSGYYEFTSVPNGIYHIAAVLNTGDDEKPKGNYAKIENISVLNKTTLTDVDISTKSRNIEIPASEMNALLERTSVSGHIYQSKKDNSNPPFPDVNVLLLKPKQGGQGYDLVANTTSNDSAYYEFTSVPNGIYHIAAVLNTGDDEKPKWNYAKIENITVSGASPIRDLDIKTKSRNIDIPAFEMNSLLDRTSISGHIYKSKKDASNPPFPGVHVLLLQEKDALNKPDLPPEYVAEHKTFVIIASNLYRKQMTEPLINISDKNITFKFFSTEEILENHGLSYDLTRADGLILARTAVETTNLFRDNLDNAIRNGTVVFNDNPDPTRNNIPDILGLTDTKDKKDAYRLKVINDYIQNGGAYPENYENVIFMILHDFCGRIDLSAAPAKLLPDSAVYHPDMPAGENMPAYFRTSVSEYVKWYSSQKDNEKHVYDPLKPTVGYVFYKKAYPSNIQTVDALIRAVEARGMNMIAVYAENNEYTEPYFTGNDGERIVDVVISSRYMGSMRFNPQKLDVPVFNAVVVNHSSEVWENMSNPLGSSLMKLVNAEINGVIDPIPVFSTSVIDNSDVLLPMEKQIEWMTNRIEKQIKLQSASNSDKNVVILYYNHGGGKNGIGASYLDVAPSIMQLLKSLREKGYNVDEASLADMNEEKLVETMLTNGYNVGTWAPGELEKLVETGSVVLIPEDTYKKWFDEMIDSMPPETGEMRKKEILDTWGDIPGDIMIYENKGQKHIILPNINMKGQYGSGGVLLAPQPMRGHYRNMETLYHSTSLVPTHQYIAFYLWLQHPPEEGGYGADSIVSMGRHGTQEWLPGKQNALSRYEWPSLMVKDIPVIYPYVMDGIGEGMAAKRRGNAIIVDHLTPSIISGFTGPYSETEQHINSYHNAVLNNNEELMKNHRKSIVELMNETHMDARFEMNKEKIDALEAQEFEDLLHDVSEALEDLKLSYMPYGLHILDRVPQGEELVSAVKAMLFANTNYKMHVSSAIEEMDENEFRKKYTDENDVCEKLIKYVLVDGKSVEDAQEKFLGSGKIYDTITKDLSKANEYASKLNECDNETEQILKALSGRYIYPKVGGDPISSPHGLPTGGNFYSFDQKKIPTKIAWEMGKEMADEMIKAYYKETGDYPSRVAFVLFSGETTRHEGVMESVILYLMGIEPKWDGSGNVDPNILNVIPAENLTLTFENKTTVVRPRIDIMVQISGQYRDIYPEKVILMDKAVKLAASQQNDRNFVKENSETLQKILESHGENSQKANALATMRIFGPPLGTYGTGLSNIIGAADTWNDTSKIADFYKQRMCSVYGETVWGESENNLFNSVLSGTDAAIHSRSSNLYGSCDNDDFYQYLGGLSLAISHSRENGYPYTYVMNLNSNGNERIENLKSYITNEIYARYFNQNWINGMKNHGYAGAREMEDFIENLWGWEATNRNLISNEIWQSAYETYFTGENSAWLKASPNTAYAYQAMAARMIETNMKGNWDTDQETINHLVSEYVQSVAISGVVCCHHTCGNLDFNRHVAGLVSVPGVVDENTASEWKKITEKALSRNIDSEDQSPSQKQNSKGSGLNSQKVSVLPLMTQSPQENKISKLPTDTKMPLPTEEEQFQGYGNDTGKSKPVSGYELKTREEDMRSPIQKFLENPTFSSTSVIAVIFVILAITIFYFGYSRRGI